MKQVLVFYDIINQKNVFYLFIKIVIINYYGVNVNLLYVYFIFIDQICFTLFLFFSHGQVFLNDVIMNFKNIRNIKKQIVLGKLLLMLYKNFHIYVKRKRMYWKNIKSVLILNIIIYQND